MYKISKRFDFCYGHRVYSQDCNVRYALDDDNPCRRMHGHQGSVEIHMSSEDLDYRGFVIDFKELAFVKKFLDTYIDHHFIVSVYDPLFTRIVGMSTSAAIDATRPVRMIDVCDSIEDRSPYRVAGRCLDSNDKQDFVNSFFIVSFNPTSESLAQWIYVLVDNVIAQSPFKVKIDRVVWSETPKTQAVYTGE